MKKFNWITVLNQAILQTPSIKVVRDLKRRAGEWPTCACGQLCKKLPRHKEDGQPVDLILTDLGFDFYGKVARREWHGALETFREIEKRASALLIKQLYKTK